MLGQMMQRPLLISALVRHAELSCPDREVVSVTADNPRHCYTYREAFQRSRKLANALRRMRMSFGDRIGTMAWNDYRHFELFFGVSASGLVCHTINPRLFAEQLSYVINHAEDRLLFLDPAFVPLIEQLASRLSTVEAFVILTDDVHMPATTLPNARSYESLIADESDAFYWREFDENTASVLCYTSGTTGDPKGVVYSHRSTILHCHAAALPDVCSLSCHDTIMPVVPMFHVYAWGLPYAAAMVGAKLVLPGQKMGDPEGLQRLIESEQVTFSAGVPTVWQVLASYLDSTGKRVDSLKRVLCGGSAVSPSLMAALQNHGIELTQGWGMTEAPIGTLCSMSPEAQAAPTEQLASLRAKQGRALFGVEMKVTDTDGKTLPRDGISSGALKVRGAWVASSYFKRADNRAFDADGWFDTGDIATICPLGYMQITDRTKDVIKSGGEWISSVEIENCVLSHPAVAQAAAIAIPDPKWQERPLLVVTLKSGASAGREELLAFCEGKVARWWIPDDVVFVEQLPMTATGKVSKLLLRKQFEGYVAVGANR